MGVRHGAKPILQKALTLISKLSVTVKLPYGLKNGNLVTIDEVESGLDCDCTCPGCKARLVGKKGTTNVHHFAHESGADCERGVTAALIKMGREVLSSTDRILLPPVFLDSAAKYRIFPETWLDIEKVTIDDPDDPQNPNVYIEAKGKKLLIQLSGLRGWNSSLRGDPSLHRLPILEISVSEVFYQRYPHHILTINDPWFPQEFISGLQYKRWVYNPKALRLKAEIARRFGIFQPLQKLESEWGYFHFVDNCPIEKRVWKRGFKRGKPYAELQDCQKCSFCLNIEYTADQRQGIYCTGHLKNSLPVKIQEALQKLGRSTNP